MIITQATMTSKRSESAMETLQNKVIVITGTTHGLGNAMTREFLCLGHKVAGCGRTESIVKQLSQEFSSIADRCDFAAVDVIQDQQVSQWAKQVVKKFGPPDVLINNVGVACRPMNFWELPAEEFNRVVDADIKGTANVTRHFVPQMISSGKGVVCNVTGWVSRNTMPNVTAIVTAKWGVEGFSKNLAQELPDPLASFQLDPGLVAAGTEEKWAKKVCPAVLACYRSMNGKLLEATTLGL